MRRSALVGLLLLLVSVAGCDSRLAKPEAGRAVAVSTVGGFPLAVSDDSGRTVTLAAPPRRIVSLAPAHTETLFALGMGDRIIAADTYSDYPAEVKDRATLDCWPRPPLERIVALRPDLVLIFTQEEEFIREMESVKIPVVKIFPQTFDQALEGIELLGRIAGVPERGQELTARLRSRAGEVTARLKGADPPRVLFEMDFTDPVRPYVAGDGGLYGDLLRMAAGRNIFADRPEPSAMVSAEQIIARDPQVILLGDAGSPVQPQNVEMVRRRPGWEKISAVRSGKIYAVESIRITRPGPRMVEGLEEIARRLHPGRIPAL